MNPEDFERNRHVVKAEQEVASAASLRSAMERCRRDRRTSGVDFEGAW